MVYHYHIFVWYHECHFQLLRQIYYSGFKTKILKTFNAYIVMWSQSRAVVSKSLPLHGLYSPWNSSGQNTGVGSLSLLQRIFPTQESNQGLLHCRQILYQLSYQGRPVLTLCSGIYHYFSINIFIMCTSLSRTVRIKYWIFLKEM